MAEKPWRNRQALALLVGTMAACAPASVQTTATPALKTTAASSPSPALPPAPAVAPPTAAPRLQLTVTPLSDHTGGEFGLTVPMLQVAVRNIGQVDASVAQRGLSMLLSLRVVLTTPTTTELRKVTIRMPRPVELQPLPPGAELIQVLSPLSQEQRDVPLAPGRYQLKVCVIPHQDAAYPSSFTQQFGSTCSDQIELTVKKGVRAGRRG